MTARMWRAVVEFIADTPEDADLLDAREDDICDSLERVISGAKHINAASVSVEELGTVDE